MKELKTHEELDKYCNILKEFEPNKVIFDKNIWIIFKGSAYREKDHSKETFIEDYFHKDFFGIAGNGFRIFNKIDILPTYKDAKYDSRDQETWTQVRFGQKDGIYLETFDVDAFSNNSVIVFTKRNREQVVVIDEKELTEKGFSKGKVNPEYWFYKTEMKDLDRLLPYKKFDHTYRSVNIEKYSQDLKNDGYSPSEISEKVNNAVKDNIKYGTDSLTYSVFEGIEYTFGVEIETCIGRPAEKDVCELNLKAVHDGSLRDEHGETPGGEYVTGVLKGDSGLVQLHEICRVLTGTCNINNKCGVHVHVGTLNWNKENIVYSYILAELLENDIFSVLPISRRRNSYCRNLTVITKDKFKQLATAKNKSQYNIIIDDMYDDIYKEVTFVKGNAGNRARFNDEDGDEDTQNQESLITSRTLNRAAQHPLGAKCGYNKDAQRYCWLNYVTLLYDTKGGGANSRTLEFRPHSATMNFIKIRNWIKICFAFCAFVERNKTDINKGTVTLEQVIESIYPKSGANLIKYIRERREVFKTKDESIDYVEESVVGKKSIKEVVCV